MDRATEKEINASLYGRRSKYGVDTTAKGREARTYQGITFHSKHEMEVYRDYVLPNLNIGVFENLKFQVRYELHAHTPPGWPVKVGTYIADFVATDRQGKPVIMDAKGYRTAEYKLKKAIFEAEYQLRIMEL